MHGEPAPAEPFRQDLHDPARVGFQLAADDTIIGTTPQEAPAWFSGISRSAKLR
jgi:hypothetical protein